MLLLEGVDEEAAILSTAMSALVTMAVMVLLVALCNCKKKKKKREEDAWPKSESDGGGGGEGVDDPLDYLHGTSVAKERMNAAEVEQGAEKTRTDADKSEDTAEDKTQTNTDRTQLGSENRSEVESAAAKKTSQRSGTWRNRSRTGEVIAAESGSYGQEQSSLLGDNLRADSSYRSGSISGSEMTLAERAVQTGSCHH